MVGICRLCAAVRKIDMLFNITDANHDICRKLRQCCQVDISADDVLPKLACVGCVESLQQAYNFYVKVHESQESLEALFALNGSSHSTSNEGLVVKETAEKILTHVLTTKKSNDFKPDIEFRPVGTETEQSLSKAEEKPTPVLSEDEVDLILEKDLEEFEDEVYLIEKILGRKCCDEKKDETATDGMEIQESVECEDQQQEPDELEFQSLQRKRAMHHDTEQTTVTVVDFQPDDDHNTAVEAGQNIGDGNGNSLIETWTTYPWQCYLCDGEEPSFPDLLLHLQVTHDLHSIDNVQFKCVDCQKECTRYYSFINHVRLRHRSALMLCCDICSKNYIDFKQLAQHRLDQHPAEPDYPKVLLCGYCGRGFSTPNSLQIHSKLHTEIKKLFVCTICDKQFKQAKSLKMHEKVHSDIKEFSCEQCGKSFRQKVNLEVHMLTHVNVKPYQCTLCRKRFKTPSSLDKHNATHTDIKKFKCDYCGNLFRTKDSKLTHERIHTGERPYKCQSCTRSFRFRGTYLSHVNIHTGKRPYSCIPCNHHFTNWSNYNKHMKRRHAAEYAATLAKNKKNVPQSSKKTNPKNVDDVQADMEDRVDSPANGYEEKTLAASIESIDDAYGFIEITPNSEASSGDEGDAE